MTGSKTHIEHLEDLVFSGRHGINLAVHCLEQMGCHFTSGISTFNITTKWDGAPAIICGKDVYNNFFVATKSVFTKHPKLMYGEDDVLDYYSKQDDLREKLNCCLRYLPELNIKGVLQGDMLYTHNDLRCKNNHIIFQPNVVEYKVPFHSDLGGRVYNSEMGIVFHTTYNSTLTESSYQVDIGTLKASKNVWYRDASLVNAIGAPEFFSESEYDRYRQHYNSARITSKTISQKVLNIFEVNETIKRLTKLYINDTIRKDSPPEFSSGSFMGFVNNKITKHIEEAKKEETKINRGLVLAEIMKIFHKYPTSMDAMFRIYNNVILAKEMLLSKLNQMKDIDMGDFIPEGYVVSSKGMTVKLIDRPVFSHKNFNMERNW